jgi:hypothetical protein
MAINSINSTTQNGVGHLCVDFATDMADLPEYARSNNLREGTDCICIEDGRVYMMQSTFEFKEI